MERSAVKTEEGAMSQGTQVTLEGERARIMTDRPLEGTPPGHLDFSPVRPSSVGLLTSRAVRARRLAVSSH